MTGGWITQACRSGWQRQAVTELAAILAAHSELPVITWTITASGGTLSGQILAPVAGRRGVFAQWRQARWRQARWRQVLELEEVSQTTSWNGTPAYLHARGVGGGVAVSVAVSVAATVFATVFDDEDDDR